ncbi:MAG: TonB-dependent receptor [Proteiniphilum sp.]|jgi:TonB-linked SusC/RagA family outer membrane protein|nr:TonB-dependent receptor [Proteiniphilum sp.]
MTVKRYVSALPKSTAIMLFCLMTIFPVIAQQRTVRGTVVDAQGESIIGASVRIEGAARGTVTDIDGGFSIQAAPNEMVRISYIGYIDALEAASSTTLHIVLQEDTRTLEEVVVVGYGTRKKETLTGAVAAVTSAEIVVTKNENVVNMLSGKLPGVRISQRSAQPGEFDNAIDIRGMGTPLIVVDGIPRDQDYFSRMDASEIESVSVLKDASAAIYGVRAANGVILVTTKRGTSAAEGKFDITFSTNYGFQSFLYMPETADAATHMLLMNEKRLNTNFGNNYFFRESPRYSYEQMFEYSSGQKPSTNWTNELFDKVSPQQQHNLSINGSSSKIDYFFNLGYMEQMGAYKSKSLNYDRWNFRGNIDTRITDRFKASIMLSGYMDERNQPFTDIWAVYKKAWTYRPTAPAWVGGDHSFPAYTSEMSESENPVAAIDSEYTGYRQVKRTNFNGGLTLSYDIPGIEGLDARAFYSYDYNMQNNTERKRTYNLYNREGDGILQEFLRNSPGSIERRAELSYATIMQLSLNYANKFGDHTVNGMLLFEEQYNFWDSFYARRNMFFDSDYLFAGDEEDQVGAMGGVGDNARQSVVGKANYDYKSKYIIDYSFRYDGSSRFPKETRWGLFQSLSAGWRLSEEGFVKRLFPFLTNMMIRGSVGRLGDDGSAGNYPPTVVGYNLTADRGWYYDGVFVTSVNPTAIPNPDLTWYTATTENVGIDFNLWNQKLTGTLEAFRRTRRGLLRTPEVELPGTVGANMPQKNIESDRTFGWEANIGHRNRWQGISYWVSGQISATKNRWIYHLDSPAGNSMENWYRQDVSGRNRDIWFAIQEAGRFESLDQIRNQHSTTGGNFGQGSLPGDYYYYDWNGDGVVNNDDRFPAATYNLPTFNYGVNGGLQWRNLDFSMNWQGSAGVYNQYDEVFTEVGPFDGGAALTMYTDRWHTASAWDDPWHPDTQWIEGYYPATGHSFNTGTTGIKNTSYIRLKSLEVGYSLPAAWITGLNFNDVRFYVNGYNLLTFSGMKYMDPERPGRYGGSNPNNDGSVLFYNYPVNRVINIGAVLKF